MAKINYNLLRQRIHWVDDYAAGMTRAQVVEKYSSEGATAGSLRTVIDAAGEIGLITGSHASTGGGVSMDLKARERLVNSGPGTAPLTADKMEEVGKVMKVKRERLKAAFTESQKAEIAQIVAQALAEKESVSKEELGERVESLRQKEEKTLVNFRLEESLLDRLDAFGRARGITKRIEALRAMKIAAETNDSEK